MIKESPKEKEQLTLSRLHQLIEADWRGGDSLLTPLDPAQWVNWLLKEKGMSLDEIASLTIGQQQLQGYDHTSFTIHEIRANVQARRSRPRNSNLRT